MHNEYIPEGTTVEDDFLFFRYPTDDGATYSFRREITVERETVNVPTGTFENAYTYSYGEESGGSLRVSFAPGVGFVLIESEGGPIELISYDVD